MREPVRVIPDRVVHGHPEYGKHIVPARCGMSFDIASFLTTAARLARRDPIGGLAEVEEQLKWILAIVPFGDFEAALEEYEHDATTIAFVRKALDAIDRTPCLSCQREDDPRDHECGRAAATARRNGTN